MKEELVPYFTFERIHELTLIICAVLAKIISYTIFSEINPISYNDISYQLPDGVLQILFYYVFVLIFSSILFRSRLSYKNTFGKFPEFSTLARYSILTIPLLIFLLCSINIQHMLNINLSPNFPDWLYDENLVTVVYPSNVKLIIANILSILCFIIITPIFAEFFFRGILLTRLSIKKGTPKAILSTSILFGILYIDVIGGIFFGFFMAIVYIKTKTLYVPICIHILNNFVVISIEIFSVMTNHISQEELNTSIGISIWIWIFVLLLVVAIMIVILRRNIPNKDCDVPYIFHNNHIDNSIN